MTRPFLIALTILVLIACMIKQDTRQWNLNRTVGWKSTNLNDYAVLFIKSKKWAASSDIVIGKRKFDEAVLKELKADKIGDQAENDEEGETDFHYIVSKDYRKAITAILSIARAYNLEQQIIIYKRDYQSYVKWIDIVVYPD